MNQPLLQDNGRTDDAAELIRRLESSAGTVCRSCTTPLCAHQVLGSIALGLGAAPRCVDCLAAALGQTRPQLTESLLGYIRARECFLAAWEWACQEGRSQSPKGSCCALAETAESG